MDPRAMLVLRSSWLEYRDTGEERLKVMQMNKTHKGTSRTYKHLLITIRIAVHDDDNVKNDRSAFVVFRISSQANVQCRVRVSVVCRRRLSLCAKGRDDIQKYRNPEHEDGYVRMYLIFCFL